jgi:hypothetical protein
MKFGVMEIGSTNTKAYRYNQGTIEELGFRTIEFKKNYNIHGEIFENDLSKLIEFINDVFGNGEDVYIYATSIFREISSDEITNIKNMLDDRTNVVEFSVVTAEQENRYTVMGAVSDIGIKDKICVFVGGGGSTEISICLNGGILEMANTSIGVGDVMKVFPDLSDDFAVSDIDEVTDYICQRLNVPGGRADYMVLAGGDFLLRYNNARYPAVKNTFFESSNHPLAISYNENRKFEDKYYKEISLNALKESTPDNPQWWNGTRAMCAFTNAVALKTEAKYIFPTRISMIYGIVADICSNCDKRIY